MAHGKILLVQRSAGVYRVDPAGNACYLAGLRYASQSSRLLMTDLCHTFEQAASDIHQLSVRPDNDTLLKLYALYKQGTEGNQSRAQPGFFDFVGIAKYDAWAQLHDVPREDAMHRYIALVQQLLA
jgi:acyl-CoA-binding protein